MSSVVAHRQLLGVKTRASAKRANPQAVSTEVVHSAHLRLAEGDTGLPGRACSS